LRIPQIFAILFKKAMYNFFFKKNEGGDKMPTNVINVRDLDEDDVKILERLAERLRAARKMKSKAEESRGEDSFKRSAGSWKGLIDGEELIRSI
jgi:hypothetical protein